MIGTGSPLASSITKPVSSTAPIERRMAFYHGSAHSLLQHRIMLPSVKQSRPFSGNVRDFSKVYRVPATRIREDNVASHERLSVSSSEPVTKGWSLPKPGQQHSQASWVERWLPAEARPYAMLARLHKPDAIWLYAWPCIWSIAIAANKGELPDMKMLALFGLGSVVLRGAACTVNDLLDRDIDKKVERTKSRPLASGALTPAQGFYFLVFQVLLWLGFLLQLNNRSLIVGSSWLVLFFSYPLMKRLTDWPQAFLGFTVSHGVLLGSAAIKEILDYTVLLPMYFAVICWALVYDTIYAHQDRKDDFKAGVKSTAITFGDNTKYWLSGFGAACISSLALTGYNAHLAWPYYPFLAAAAGHLQWQVSTVNLSDKSDCNRKFVSNKWFGALVFGGILCGILAS